MTPLKRICIYLIVFFVILSILLLTLFTKSGDDRFSQPGIKVDLEDQLETIDTKLTYLIETNEKIQKEISDLKSETARMVSKSSMSQVLSRDEDDSTKLVSIDSLSSEELSKLRNFQNYLKSHVQQMLEHFQDYLSINPRIILDIGANLCAFSLRVKEICNGCEITAFEPVPNYAAFCKQTLFSHSKFTIYPFAIGDKEERLTLHMDSSNLGWNTLEDERKTEGMTSIDVPVMTLDKFFEGKYLPNIDFIKIDVEGSEWRVLSGMHKTLERLNPKPILVIEVTWGESHPHWQEEVDQFEWLISNGYQRTNYHVTQTQDVLFIPEVYYIPNSNNPNEKILDPSLGIKLFQ